MRCNMSKLLNIMIIITICVCLNSCCTKAAKERKSRDVYSHTIQLSSLSPSSTSCVRSSKASNTKSSLEVVHRHGPCSSLSSGKAIDHAEILRHDQDRVNSIYSKLSKRFEDPVTQTQATVLPALDGRLLKFGNYFVTVGVGTPRHNLSLAFDTGSDLTWTQCEPCDVGNCYSQTEPIFNPSSSSSYSNISCSSSDCADLTSQGIKRVCSSLTSTCGYSTEYGDSSTTSGFLATEKFTLTNTDVIDGVKFGCGKNNKGLFKGIAGLLGLGRGKFSFPSQTKMTYKNIFSYCIPSSPNKIGHLTFGSTGISNSVKYTPIRSLSETFYVIDMEGIIVDNKRLQIPSNVAVIDSGSVITRLPPKSYAALRTAFKEYMSKSNYTITNGDGLLLDTCYDFTGVNTVNVPRISFSLGGGTVVELDQKGILYQIGESQYCLGFAANGNDNSPILFGNVQQKRLDVVYDGLNGRIGFGPNGCN